MNFDLQIAEHYRHPVENMLLHWKLFTKPRILVVVDTEIGTDPAVGFGVGRVIELIRSKRIGCVQFKVDIARRDGQAPAVVDSPGPYDPNYVGFRFDMEHEGDLVIDDYHQIWCFGFKPDNFGGSDDRIDLPTSFPASDSELRMLSDWMDRTKGGLFGTGDHDYLGASMCHRIPRLGTMRRWTNADGVPPIGTSERIDTLRPPTPAYEPGAPGGPLDLGNGAHQGDLTPQPIKWSAWQWSYWPFFWLRKRPHPVLCHPTLGPIDVMPDHAHEGLCRPVSEIDLDREVTFDGETFAEYPDAVGGGAKPKPQVIAYGSTLGDPPYNFSKGAQPARASFPMISAYDGHRAGVGRVVTDSTWHHWMDVNIDSLAAADGNDWHKISRYFQNIALWLNPPGLLFDCFKAAVLESHFHSVGLQEFRPGLKRRDLGRTLHSHLSALYGPCWVTERIWLALEALGEWKLDFRPSLEPPDDLQGLPGIDPDELEFEYLGSLVEASMPLAEEIRRAADKGPINNEFRLDLEDPDEVFVVPASRAMAETGRVLVEAQRRKTADLSQLTGN